MLEKIRFLILIFRNLCVLNLFVFIGARDRPATLPTTSIAALLPRCWPRYLVTSPCQGRDEVRSSIDTSHRGASVVPKRTEGSHWNSGRGEMIRKQKHVMRLSVRLSVLNFWIDWVHSAGLNPFTNLQRMEWSKSEISGARMNRIGESKESKVQSGRYDFLIRSFQQTSMFTQAISYFNMVTMSLEIKWV